MTGVKAAALPAGWRLDRRGVVASTNAEAAELARKGAAEGTVVWAENQTAGRGRGDRVWMSPPGNLFFSFVLRPDRDLLVCGQLSFLTSLALAEAVTEVAPAVATTCKWPNDVLVSQGKLSGILLETSGYADGRPEAVIVGVGVNVAWRPESGALYPAASLAAEGADVDAETVLCAFLRRFAAWYEIWLRDGFVPVRTAWIARAKGIGRPVTVRLPDETLHGIFESLDEDGALVLSGLPEGTRLIHAGDVFFG